MCRIRDCHVQSSTRSDLLAICGIFRPICRWISLEWRCHVNVHVLPILFWRPIPVDFEHSSLAEMERLWHLFGIRLHQLVPVSFISYFPFLHERVMQQSLTLSPQRLLLHLVCTCQGLVIWYGILVRRPWQARFINHEAFCPHLRQEEEEQGIPGIERGSAITF